MHYHATITKAITSMYATDSRSRELHFYADLPLNSQSIIMWSLITVENEQLQMRAVVHEVGCCFPTSIISGRSREKVV